MEAFWFFLFSSVSLIPIIITRLKPQLPDNTPLTFSADFGMLKKEYPGAETNFGVDEEQL